MPRTKVLLIHNHYGTGGGAETHFQNLVSALRGRGFDVYTFALSANVESLMPERDYVYWKHGRPRSWKLWRYVFHPGIYMALRRIVKRIQPDWIHLHVVEQPLSILPALRDQVIVHSGHSAGPVCATSLLTRRDDLQLCEGGIGLKCLRHHCVQPVVFLPNWYLEAIGNWLLKRYVRAFLPPSEYLANHLRRQGFAPVRSLPLFAVGQLVIRDDGRGQRIIFIGTLTWNKGPQFLMEAIKPISAGCPHARLIVLGDGPLRTDLQKQAEKLQVADRVEFVGKVTAAQAARFYEEADVCVIPSLFEICSMVACEAMLHSLPIVASRRGYMSELVVDGETGLLVEPTDPQAIAAAILRLLHNPDEARRMGRNGYDRARRLYSLDTYLQNLADIVRFATEPREKVV